MTTYKRCPANDPILYRLADAAQVRPEVVFTHARSIAKVLLGEDRKLG